jgi:hypothetical protein
VSYLVSRKSLATRWPVDRCGGDCPWRTSCATSMPSSHIQQVLEAPTSRTGTRPRIAPSRRAATLAGSSSRAAGLLAAREDERLPKRHCRTKLDRTRPPTSELRVRRVVRLFERLSLCFVMMTQEVGRLRIRSEFVADHARLRLVEFVLGATAARPKTVLKRQPPDAWLGFAGGPKNDSNDARKPSAGQRPPDEDLPSRRRRTSSMHIHDCRRVGSPSFCATNGRLPATHHQVPNARSSGGTTPTSSRSGRPRRRLLNGLNDS